jgi:hypothetical protein
MVLHLFTNVITLTDNFLTLAKGIHATNLVWLTVKARTNGFTIASTDNATDGFRVPAGISLDLPISDMVGKTGIFSLDGLYWANTVAGDNCVVEIIGMRDLGIVR